MSDSRHLWTDGRSGLASIRIDQQPIPEPAPGEVRVAVTASGIGFADVMSLFGGYPLAPRPPFTPGYELVGRVEESGPGVTHLAEGQRVVALNPGFGCQADHVCLPADLCVPVAEEVDAAQAVALVLNYLTAHCILHRKAQVRAGETVLIHSAAGGVGTALLQLGRGLDLTMYGTASLAKHGVVTEQGGIPIDYRQHDFEQVIRAKEPEGIDAAFDPVGGTNLRKSYRVVRRGGRVISYGFSGARLGGFRQMLGGVLLMGLLNARPDGKRVRLCATPGEVRRDNAWYQTTLTSLVDRLEKGELSPVVGARVAFQEARDGYQQLVNGSVTGKVVLMH